MQRLYPLLFVFLWSTGFIGAKYGLPYAEPLSFLLTRYGLVIALMLLIALATRAPWPERRSDWLHIGVSGILVHAIYLGGVFVAIKHGLSAGVTARSGQTYDTAATGRLREASNRAGTSRRRFTIHPRRCELQPKTANPAE